nr:MAG TPA: hypothetical protein [Caudoviricetes sp.]
MIGRATGPAKLIPVGNQGHQRVFERIRNIHPRFAEPGNDIDLQSAQPMGWGLQVKPRRTGCGLQMHLRCRKNDRHPVRLVGRDASDGLHGIAIDSYQAVAWPAVDIKPQPLFDQHQSGQGLQCFAGRLQQPAEQRIVAGSAQPQELAQIRQRHRLHSRRRYNSDGHGNSWIG